MLRIYDVAGRMVRTLVDEVQAPQPQGLTVEWDGRVASGAPARSGVYFYRLEARGISQSRKMVLIK